MSAEYQEAPQELLDIAQELIESYHGLLAECRVGFLLRLDEPVSGGKRVLGKTKKIAPELKEFMELDFLIWISEEFWHDASHRQRCALIDHELHHCSFDGEKFSTRRHDLEEFVAVIERWGIWKPDVKQFAQAIQPHLPIDGLQKDGGVVQVDPDVWGAALEGELEEEGATDAVDR